MHRHHHAAREPGAEQGDEIQRMVRPAQVQRLVAREARLAQRDGDGLRLGQQPGVAEHPFPGNCFARGVAPGGSGEQRFQTRGRRVVHPIQERSTTPAAAPVSAPFSQVTAPFTMLYSMPCERITMRFAPPGRS